MEGERGFPIHKLCSNDGWLVTPEECRTAAERWAEERAFVEGDGITFELTDEFVDWVRRAADHGGFRVY